MKRIAPSEMQKIFNDGEYWERSQRGELSVVILENRHPSLMKAKEPLCTQSQMLSYRDGAGYEVARVHQYLRPDGTIGASGKPDPKRVFKDGELYRLQKTPKEPQKPPTA
jgi:hypothetical protein